MLLKRGAGYGSVLMSMMTAKQRCFLKSPHLRIALLAHISRFGIDEWNAMMRRGKTGSSRGACGFSMMDVKRTPEYLLEWFFFFLQCC